MKEKSISIEDFFQYYRDNRNNIESYQFISGRGIIDSGHYRVKVKEPIASRDISTYE